MHASARAFATVESVDSRRYLLSAAIVSTLLFLLLVHWVLSGESLPFDLAIRAAVHGWASPLLTNAMLPITTLGSALIRLPLAAILAVWLAVTGRRRPAILLAAAAVAAEPVVQLLKLAVHRPRPEVFFGLAPAETYSFPSGHTFGSTIFYGLLAGILMSFANSHRKRVSVAIFAVLLILLIGLSRVYLGYHYPSDVLGGWTSASASLALLRLALLRPPINPTRETHEEHHQ